MGRKREDSPTREVRLRRVNGGLCEEIKNIAVHHGISATQLLKPHLQALVDSFPEHMKIKRPCEPCREVRITGVSQKTVEQLENIADYFGTDVTSLLKFKLTEVANGYSAHMKTPVQR